MTTSLRGVLRGYLLKSLGFTWYVVRERRTVAPPTFSSSRLDGGFVLRNDFFVKTTTHPWARQLGVVAPRSARVRGFLYWVLAPRGRSLEDELASMIEALREEARKPEIEERLELLHLVLPPPERIGAGAQQGEEEGMPEEEG